MESCADCTARVELGSLMGGRIRVSPTAHVRGSSPCVKTVRRGRVGRLREDVRPCAPELHVGDYHTAARRRTLLAIFSDVSQLSAAVTAILKPGIGRCAAEIFATARRSSICAGARRSVFRLSRRRAVGELERRLRKARCRARTLRGGVTTPTRYFH